MKAKYSLSLAAGALVAGVALAVSPGEPVRMTFDGMAAEPIVLTTAGVSRMAAPAEGTIQVDFTTKGSDARKPEITYDFNDGLQGWTCDPTTHAVWSHKNMTASHPFTEIDPADAGSLYVDGDYRVYNREITNAVSPEFTVPSQGRADFYVGFSLNYDDVCRLILAVSDDKGKTWTDVWNSKDATGEKPWAWRAEYADLTPWAGKAVKLRFQYSWGSEDEMFKTGGYLGDFAIDNVVISGMQAVESVSLTTGERLTLSAIAPAEGWTYAWNMPGATPATSTEAEPTVYYTADGDYDITLTVTDPQGNTGSRTRAAFVKVTGTAPTARIVPPATFRYQATRLPMICPYVPVTFPHDNGGFPTTAEWTFTGIDGDGVTPTARSGHEQTVDYKFLHQQTVTLTATNSHGTATDNCQVSAEYAGLITNARPGEKFTCFDMDDWGYFPGSNTQKITAYAERFSKPSHPVVINGARVYFLRADADNIADQIQSITVRLCKSENGLPGETIDFGLWSVFELDTPSGNTLVGTDFEWDPVMIDDEFFIVVDGFPAYTEPKPASGDQEATNGTCVVMAMTEWRGEGNTALMLKDDKWIDVSTYFPAGANHTSLAVMPNVCHSVVETLPMGVREYLAGKDAGTLTIDVYTMFGWKSPVETDGTWLRVTNTPGEETVDKLEVAYDALPAGTTERTGKLTLTDGYTSRDIYVRQSAAYDGLESIGAESAATGDVYDLLGRRYAPDAVLAPGVYMRAGEKFVVK